MNTDYSSKVLDNMVLQLEKTLERKRQFEAQRAEIDALIEDTNAVIQSVERFISNLNQRVLVDINKPRISEKDVDETAGEALSAALHDLNSHLQ